MHKIVSMLDKLREIEWNNLNHAFGDASDVPELIVGLLSGDKKVFEKSIYELFGNIWHQGTVYEATPITIPFLIYIFENKEILDRNSLLVLLASIAAGSGYYEVHSTVKITTPFTGNIVEPPANLDSLLKKERKIVTEVQKKCLPLLDTFISNLSNSEPSVRESVAQALAKYPAIKDKSLPALETQLQKENNPDVVHYLEESIQELKNA